MAKTFNGTTDHLSYASALLTAAPFTFSAWVYYTGTVGNEDTIMSFSANDTSLHYFDLYRPTASGKLMFETSNTTTTSQSQSVGNLTANTWHHCVGVCRSSTNCQSYLDGVGSTVGTTNITPVVNTTRIGCLKYNGSDQYFWQGRLAEIAIWNTVLTDAEITSLYQKFSPLLIRPQNLSTYIPLINNTNNFTSPPFVVSGTTTIDHPPIIYP